VSEKVLIALKERFQADILSTHSFRGDDTVVVNPERLLEIATFLKTDPEMAFNMPIDVTAVDYLHRTPRFDVIYHLYSTILRHRLRIKVPAFQDKPEVSSLTPLYRGFNWFEREVYDMFGIRFIGHPDLRRILLYEDFEGYPLRKDYPILKTQPLQPYRSVDVQVPESPGPSHRPLRERGFTTYGTATSPGGREACPQQTPHSHEDFIETHPIDPFRRTDMKGSQEK